MGILRDIFERVGVAGDVLVLADSTIAYGVDKQRHVSWYTMSRYLERACPSVTSVWFCAYSGATIDGLAQYAEESLAGWGETYDFAVVVAGRNSNGVPCIEIGRHLAHLQGAIGQKIRRRRDGPGFGGTSGADRDVGGSRDLGGSDSSEDNDRIVGSGPRRASCAEYED